MRDARSSDAVTRMATRRILVRADGQPWTWPWAVRRAGPGWLGIAFAGALIFRALGLSWPAVAVMLVVSLAGGIAFVLWQHRQVRRRPINLLSTAAHFLPDESGHVFNCPDCGWQGGITELVRAASREGMLQLNCPSCGRQLARTAARITL
jgi:predicted RNA-binding Zn-ribbon protein involved in translation (DUF1610 family)